MQLIKLQIVLLATFTSIAYAGLYANTNSWPGPDNFCGGTRQSPIDVSDSTTIYDQNLKRFEWRKIAESTGEFTVINDGTTIKVTVPNGLFELTMNGTKYDLDQYHVHWASDVNKGSEHTVNGKDYPMEIHFVHHKRDYGTLGDSLNKADGLLVMGFVYKYGTGVKADIAAKFYPVDAKGITGKNDQVKIPSFDIPAMMEKVANLDEFVLYPGSLTTPKCHEVVTWVFHPKPIIIDEMLMSRIRLVKLDGGDVRNYREPQPLHGRTVLKSFKGTVSSSQMTIPSFACILLAVLFGKYFNY